MRHYKPKPGTKSSVHRLITPFPDIAAFDKVVQSLVLTNPLGCTSYRTVKKNHPPLAKIREMYTAKFVYEDKNGRQIGTGQETYDTVDGYQLGIAAVISNMANTAAHRAKARHSSGKDHFSVILKCHDPSGEMFFLSLARDRVTVSSYSDNAIRDRVAGWTDSIPELA